VGRYGEEIGVQSLTPHKLRHSAITAALDATGGDVRRVQRLSRQAKLETLQRYDDNRNDLQGEVTRTLAALFGD
jgi:integrase/recombinase XerC